MKEKQFLQWLKNNNIQSSENYVSRIKTIENYYGNIDDLFDLDMCAGLLKQFIYSQSDQDNNVKPLHKIPQTSTLGKDIFQSYKEGTNDYKSRIKKYVKFRQETDGHALQDIPMVPRISNTSANPISLNRIFYGPPGTGKTWHTIDAALEILDSEAAKMEECPERKARFDALMQEKRVRFVTFHQSFSYEDFVEGIRPETTEGDEGSKGISYAVKSGIFKEMCEAAQARTIFAEDASIDLAGRSVWKMSLGNSCGDTAYIYEECLKNNMLLMGYGNLIDFSSCQTCEAIRQKLQAEGFSDAEQNGYTCTALNTFLLQMRKGDLVIVTEGLTKFRGIAEITGDYEAVARNAQSDTYGQGRKVRWLRQYAPSLDVGKLLKRQFSQMTLYRLNLSTVEKSNLENLLAPVAKSSEPEPHVLIIDEINRGNIAGIFGELITLIEPSKRLGAEDELRVHLPYSREPFGVPDNLYIIGTMNSADRSLTGLDIALRRRFTFKEMCPDSDLLKGKVLQGTSITVGDVLTAMNQRIEVLLDRDHCIGHAPFMTLGDTVTAADLAIVFEGSIVPLLQEYFFEDWGKIRRVLNDHKKEKDFCFIVEKTIPTDILEQEEQQRPLWRICHDAFGKMESYAGIVEPDIKAGGFPALKAEIEHDIDPSCIRRELHWREYHLIQYKDKNSQQAIRIYSGEMLVHGNSPDSDESIKDVLRKINSAENLGISTSDEGNTYNFGNLVFDKLGIPARS